MCRMRGENQDQNMMFITGFKKGEIYVTRMAVYNKKTPTAASFLFSIAIKD